MTVRIQCLVLDSADPQRLAGFWEQALGWRRTQDTPESVVPEPPAHSLEDGIAADLLFVRVRDDKAGKNRLHLDLGPDDQASEVARLLGLGAAHADVGHGTNVSWVVMADPEGNEFCILKPLTSEQNSELDAIRRSRLP